MSKKQPSAPRDPWKDILAGWCGNPWEPTRLGVAGSYGWCAHCGASQQVHDIGTIHAADAAEIATLRATVEQQAARITALEQALKQVLRFQYEHRGMGTYACRSCGAQAQLDEWVGIQRREACSPSCPWGVARQALETP